MTRRFRKGLSAKTVRSLLLYDEFTGELRFRDKPPSNAGRKPGNDPGYRSIKIRGKCYMAHRVIWLYMTGRWPRHFIDHVDTDKRNNRWLNLREAGDLLNAENQRKAHKNSKTGVLGVSPSPKGRGFVAQIRFKGAVKYLGLFPDVDSASTVYLQAKRRLHQGCTL